MLTTLACGGMKNAMALMKDVFPVPVPQHAYGFLPHIGGAPSESRQEPVFEEEENMVIVPVQRGVEDIGNILNKMKEKGINIQSMSVKKPTLDDVFMRLTGHHVTEEEKINNKKS